MRFLIHLLSPLGSWNSTFVPETWRAANNAVCGPFPAISQKPEQRRTQADAQRKGGNLDCDHYCIWHKKVYLKLDL